LHKVRKAVVMNYPTHRRARVLHERHSTMQSTAAAAPSVKTQAKLAAINARLAKLAGGVQ
jgi:hypothetical protein